MALAAEGAHWSKSRYDGIVRWSHIGRPFILQHKVKEALLVERLGQACWQQQDEEKSQPHGLVHRLRAEPRDQSRRFTTKVSVSHSCIVPAEGGPAYPPIA